MLAWIQAHIAVILICVALVAVLALAVWSLVRDKKRGKSSCGANCAHCAMAGKCHGGQGNARHEDHQKD